jgi:hypothetical protein
VDLIEDQVFARIDSVRDFKEGVWEMEDQVENFDDQVKTTGDQVTEMTDQVKAKKAKVRERADQDQIIMNFVGDMENNLDALDADAELATLMLKRRFTETKREEGRGALGELKASVQARQVALGAQGERATQSEGDEKLARLKYADFRKIVRTAFTDADTRKALGVSGLVPVDTEKFLALAELGYNAAQEAPYKAPLEALGFDAVEQTASVATLTTFKAARIAHRAAIATAQAATKSRDDAYKIARKWNTSLINMAQIALREHSALLAKLR